MAGVIFANLWTWPKSLFTLTQVLDVNQLTVVTVSFLHKWTEEERRCDLNLKLLQLADERTKSPALTQHMTHIVQLDLYNIQAMLYMASIPQTTCYIMALTHYQDPPPTAPSHRKKHIDDYMMLQARAARLTV